MDALIHELSYIYNRVSIDYEAQLETVEYKPTIDGLLMVPRARDRIKITINGEYRDIESCIYTIQDLGIPIYEKKYRKTTNGYAEVELIVGNVLNIADALEHLMIIKLGMI